MAWLLSNFPNLESINLENNPVKTKNLQNLTSEQFSKLIGGIKEKKFRIVSWQGSILMDLLEYAQSLVARGHTNHNAHTTYLKELVQAKPTEVINTEIKPKTEQIPNKNLNNNAYLLVGGLVFLLGSVLFIGYWLGKRKRHYKE